MSRLQPGFSIRLQSSSDSPTARAAPASPKKRKPRPDPEPGSSPTRTPGKRPPRNRLKPRIEKPGWKPAGRKWGAPSSTVSRRWLTGASAEADFRFRRFFRENSASSSRTVRLARNPYSARTVSPIPCQKRISTSRAPSLTRAQGPVRICSDFLGKSCFRRVLASPIVPWGRTGPGLVARFPGPFPGIFIERRPSGV